MKDVNTDPAKIALADRFESVVEKILRHEGDVKRKSSLDFLVRWKDESPESDLWLPWKELRDNAVLHEYLREHNLGKLIPKDFINEKFIANERERTRKRATKQRF